MYTCNLTKMHAISQRTDMYHVGTSSQNCLYYQVGMCENEQGSQYTA